MTIRVQVKSSTLFIFRWLGPGDRLADGVLDRRNYSLHWSNSGVVLGEGDPEFDRLELDVEAGDNLQYSVDQVLACLDNIKP